MTSFSLKKILLIIGGLVVLGGLIYWLRVPATKEVPAPPAANDEAIGTSTDVTTGGAPETERPRGPEAVASDLTVPWEIVFLPGGDMLVTERPGRLKRLGQTPQSFTIGGVAAVGEGGLLGLALHPDFLENSFIYLYLTSRDGGSLKNRVERYRYDGRELTERQVIIDDIPAGGNHDGGRLAFGPDRLLYITTGDTGRSSLAQDRNSLAGKILRLSDDGSVPADNPFNNPVWSYGHRNPQGLAWDAEGRLWSVEHGRSGVLSGLDELNLIEAGKNYGWPTIEGDERREGMETPRRHSGSRSTWAPAAIVSAGGQVLFTGLRGTAIYRSDISGSEAGAINAYWEGDYGRLRALTLGPDGLLYIGTSNRDGRGRPQEGDDKIIRVSPSLFGIEL